MLWQRYICKREVTYLAVLCFLFALPNVSRAQCVNCMSGREFWLMFLEAYDDESVYSLVAATSENTTITVENIAMNWSSTVVADANSVVTIPLPANVARSFANVSVDSVGLHVTSDRDIVLYASNFRDHSFDMTAVLPAGALDTEYVVQTLMERMSSWDYIGYRLGECVGVLATDDSTEVTMLMPCDVRLDGVLLYEAGDTIRVELMRGETWQVSGFVRYIVIEQSTSTLSGMKIASNGKPIAVFQGNKCPYLHTGMTEPEGATSACDHVYEQALPKRFWGQRFVVVSTYGYIVGSDVVEVTSSADNCEVRLNGTVIDTLMERETGYYELREYVHDTDTSIHAYLFETGKPSCVFLYTGNGSQTRLIMDANNPWGAAGDPSSVYIPPVEQSLSFSRFQTVNTPATSTHYVNIVARSTDTADVFCDGQSISFISTEWGYCYANVEVPQGVHEITSTHGRFQAFVYGRGDAECYAYVASMALHDLENTLFADEVDVSMMTSDIVKCIGDTTVFTLKSERPGHSVMWLVNGEETEETDTVFIHIADRRGWIRVDAVVDEGCDTLTAFVNVPNDTMYVDTSVCSGNAFVWDDNTYTQSGEYIYPIDGEMCHFVHISLAVRQTPTIVLEALSDCEAGETVLTLTMQDTVVPILWTSVPEGYVPESMDTVMVLTVNPPQRTQFTVQVGARCLAVQSVTVALMRREKARFIVSPERLMTNEFSITATDISVACDRREWLINGQLMSDVGETLVYNVRDRVDSITVMLVIWNGDCSDTAYRVIPVRNEQLWAPNIFTPAKDDNATFSIVTQDIEQSSLDIFDRKGLLVFHSDNPVEGWDGTYKGTYCPQGTYVWHLRYHVTATPQSEKMATGTVMLLR